MGKCCLRPEFTQQLLALLAHGECVNLISPHGQGRRRTLQDLHKLAPKSWHILQVDMRAIEVSGLSLLDELAKQAKFENISLFDEYLEKMDNNSIYFLIIVHNFDILTDLNAILYLNDIGKNGHVSLLCVSEKKQHGSALLATDCILPAITAEQLVLEIKRRGFALEKQAIESLVTFLLQQQAPYSLLDERSQAWFYKKLAIK